MTLSKNTLVPALLTSFAFLGACGSTQPKDGPWEFEFLQAEASGDCEGIEIDGFGGYTAEASLDIVDEVATMDLDGLDLVGTYNSEGLQLEGELEAGGDETITVSLYGSPIGPEYLDGDITFVIEHEGGTCEVFSLTHGTFIGEGSSGCNDKQTDCG